MDDLDLTKEAKYGIFDSLCMATLYDVSIHCFDLAKIRQSLFIRCGVRTYKVRQIVVSE